jgi:hypothetical protein
VLNSKPIATKHRALRNNDTALAAPIPRVGFCDLGIGVSSFNCVSFYFTRNTRNALNENSGVYALGKRSKSRHTEKEWLLEKRIKHHPLFHFSHTFVARKRTFVDKKATFMARKLTFVAKKTTFMARKQTFVAKKQTFVAKKQTFRHTKLGPFFTSL